QHHDRNYEQDVNEAAQRIGADQSKQPEHQQDHEYCPEHKVLSVKLSLFRLQWSPPTDKINDEHDHSDDEQQMDERATKMADEAEEPEHEQNYEYCPEHWSSFRLSHTYLRARQFCCAYQIIKISVTANPLPPRPAD